MSSVKPSSCSHIHIMSKKVYAKEWLASLKTYGKFSQYSSFTVLPNLGI